MARGRKAEVGDTNVSANGYHYTRTETGWRLTHHIIAEKKFGRTIGENERAIFIDGKRSNLSPSNIDVVPLNRGSARRRLAQLKARRDELDAQISELETELDIPKSSLCEQP